MFCHANDAATSARIVVKLSAASSRQVPSGEMAILMSSAWASSKAAHTNVWPALLSNPLQDQVSSTLPIFHFRLNNVVVVLAGFIALLSKA